MCTIIPCKSIADDWLRTIQVIIKQNNFTPVLHIYSNPEDEAGKVYVKNKIRAAEKVGIEVHDIPTTGFEFVEDLIDDIAYSCCTGIIVQLPVEERFKPYIDKIQAAIPYDKDVDGLREGSAFVPCTAFGIIHLLDWIAEANGTDIYWEGAECCIVGRSKLVGAPLSEIMINATDSTTTVCNSRTVDLAAHTKRADILVVATGKPGLITKDMVKPGAIVIDVGINRVNGELVGDVAPDVEEVAGFMTKLGKQGSVGRLTVAALLSNCVKACKMKRDREERWK